MKLKFFSWLFFILSIALTFVSLSAGYYLYSALFTVSTALLICSVFEILRLSTLYAVSVFSKTAKFIVSSLYLIIVAICFFASVISLDTQIIQKNNENVSQIEKQIEQDLYKIRHEYSKAYDVKLDDLYKKRDGFNQKLARNPRSKYYNRRLQQTDEEIIKLENERNEKLNKVSFGNIKIEEIKTHLSILGIESSGVYTSKEHSAFQQALNGLFDMDVLQLQKLIGYALAFGIEASILLLAILGFYLNKMTKKENSNEIISENIIENITDNKEVKIDDIELNNEDIKSDIKLDNNEVYEEQVKIADIEKLIVNISEKSANDIDKNDIDKKLYLNKIDNNFADIKFDYETSEHSILAEEPTKEQESKKRGRKKKEKPIEIKQVELEDKPKQEISDIKYLKDEKSKQEIIKIKDLSEKPKQNKKEDVKTLTDNEKQVKKTRKINNRNLIMNNYIPDFSNIRKSRENMKSLLNRGNKQG